MVDPAIDRDEFKKRLNSIFDNRDIFTYEEAIDALLEKNEIKRKELKEKLNGQKEKINGYLADWDAATTYEEKLAVVSSVKRRG